MVAETKPIPKAVNDGRDLAIQLIPAIKLFTDHCETDEDKLLFWAGFYSAMSGMMAAEIGEEALTVLTDSCVKNTKITIETAKQGMH
jgi:hypothetical protein